MNKTQEALKMAIKEMKTYAFKHECDYQCKDNELIKAINACKEALEAEQICQAQEVECSNHPDAPHGFCRDASHSAGRYVCECEGWRAAEQ